MSLTNILKSTMLLFAFGLTACQDKAEQSTENIPTQSAEKAQVSEVAKTPPSPPSFADMINISKPLGVVGAAYRPLAYEKVTHPGLDEALKDFTKTSRSYSLIVWHKGQIVYENYPKPHSADTRAESASMHKSVLGLLVGAAIEDGFISGVEAPIGRYIPEWKDDARGKITIRDLLEMRSGLNPLDSAGGMESQSMKFWQQGEGARDIMMSMELSPKTEKVFAYQNAVSQILGLIIENSSGLSYHDYLSKRLWKPIGAKEAKVWFNEEDGFPRVYTGLFAVPRDWLRLGILVKDRGRFSGKQIISKSYVSAMTLPSRANPNYGWQIWRGEVYEPARFYTSDKTGIGVKSSEPFAVKDMLYFDGFGGQRVYISRSEDLVIVRSGDVQMDWDESKLPNLVLSNL